MNLGPVVLNMERLFWDVLIQSSSEPVRHESHRCSVPRFMRPLNFTITDFLAKILQDTQSSIIYHPGARLFLLIERLLKEQGHEAGCLLSVVT
jgi:hypothetical protein